jgi:hypothetical protein
LSITFGRHRLPRLRRPIRSLTGGPARARDARRVLPAGALAQAVPDAEVGFSAFFNRDHANRWDPAERS